MILQAALNGELADNFKVAPFVGRGEVDGQAKTVGQRQAFLDGVALVDLVALAVGEGFADQVTAV